jgi:putative ABC transport system permease protein
VKAFRKRARANRNRSIIGLVVGEVAGIVLVGVAAGLAISVAATRALQNLLFNLGPHHVSTLAGASVLLAVVALLAAYVPERRAARIDPMIALRCE